MHTLDIFSLQNLKTILQIYEWLENNQTCLLIDDGVPVGMIVPLGGNQPLDRETPKLGFGAVVRRWLHPTLHTPAQ